MSLARTAKVLRALLFLLPACVIRLSDRNAPLENGGVSGAAADCSVAMPLGEGAPSTDPKAVRTKYVGRFDFTDPNSPAFDWSGNSMNTRFHGTEVTWGAESGVELVFEQILDGVSTQVILGGLVDHKTVTLTVPDGDHELTIVRSSEALFSVGAFIPFTFGATTQQLAPTDRPRRIEIIGDSITCGYGDEGENATCPYDVPIRPELDANNKPIYNKAGEQQFVKVPQTQNIYLAYGSIAGRKLAADTVTLCFSGKGVVLNYREQGVGEGKLLNASDDADPDAKTTIPDYYLRTQATIGANQTCKLTDPAKAANGRGPSADCISNDCDQGLCRCTTSADCCADKNAAACDKKNSACGAPPATALGAGGNTCHNPKYHDWDFTKDQPQPQVVVINIGTNDFARDVNQDSVADGIDLNAFHAGYRKFVDFVRANRPDAHIFLAVPPMVTDVFPLTNARTDFRNTLNAVASEMNTAGDAKIYSMELVEMGVRYGLGCDYHPNLAVHRIMADQVVGAIKSKTCWSTVDTP